MKISTKISHVGLHPKISLGWMTTNKLFDFKVFFWNLPENLFKVAKVSPLTLIFEIRYISIGN